MYHGFHKHLIIPVFNFDSKNKCYLSSKSAYFNDFWRIMWHWRLE